MFNFTSLFTSQQSRSIHLSRQFWLFAFSLLCISSFSEQALAQTKKQLMPQPIHTLYAAGDIADCRKTEAAKTMAAQTAARIQSLIAKDNNAYVVTLGDNTYPIGRAEEFRDCYDQTWGKFKAITLPSPGNHDYGVPLATGYFNYFDELAGPARQGFYKKILGNWLILSLNSNIQGQAMQEQLTWLNNTLMHNESRCVLAFWHHPVYSSGGHGNNKIMQEIWGILATAKADLVLSGHDHHYERFAPLDQDGKLNKQGIRSFVVGTGGAKLSPLFFRKNGSEIRQNDHHGILQLQLFNDAYRWEFLSTSQQNKPAFTDQGRAQCHRT